MHLASLDPFLTDEMIIKRDTTPVSVDAHIYRMWIKGYSNATFTKVTGLDKDLLEIMMVAPVLTYGGPFISKARILWVNFDNNGIFHVKMRKR